MASVYAAVQATRWHCTDLAGPPSPLPPVPPHCPGRKPPFFWLLSAPRAHGKSTAESFTRGNTGAAYAP